MNDKQKKKKKIFLYEDCNWKKREGIFVQNKVFPIVFPKESSGNPSVQHVAILQQPGH